MDAPLNAAAPHHLPLFITAPGQTDILMVVTGVILLAAVIGFGVLFFWLHSLPERIAHKSHKLQMEIVAVLCLLALFTHIHLFWVIGLLLAMIDIPDFGGWMGRIATSTEKIAGIRPAPAEPETSDAAPVIVHSSAGNGQAAGIEQKEPAHA